MISSTIDQSSRSSHTPVIPFPSQTGRGLTKLFALVCLVAVWPFSNCTGSEKDQVGFSAYSLMFDSVSQAQTIERIIKLCSEKGSKKTWKLPSYKSSKGVLRVKEFAQPLEKMQETILSSRKERIFRTKCHAYSRDIAEQKARIFMNGPKGRLAFLSNHEVNGNFKSRFAYQTRAEWVKSGNWLLEKEDMLPPARQIRGRGGQIDDLHYFTILAGRGERTLRITASWCSAGGKLPVIGRVQANYQDIVECMDVENRDVQKYFENTMAARKLVRTPKA